MVEPSFVPPNNWLTRQAEDHGAIGVPFALLVTLLAAALRFYRLGYQSLWVDEIKTWKMVQPDLGLEFWQQIGDAIQGPLYLAAIWPLAAVNDSEVMLRLPAAVAGVLTVPIAGVAVARMLGSRAGRLTAFLIAISPLHIWYSQEARGYAFAVLFSLLATLVFMEMARRGPKVGTAILFALLTACGIWSNMSALFVWCGLGLTLLLAVRPQRWSVWRWWLVAFGGGLVVALPWLLRAAGIWAVDRLVPGTAVGEALRGETTFDPLYLPFTGYAFFFGYSLEISLRDLHLPDRLAVLRQHWPLIATSALVVAVPLLAGLFRLRRRNLVVLLWIAVPLAAVTLLAVRNVKTFNPRYALVALPWVLALTAYGLTVLPRRIGVVVSSLLLALTVWSLIGYYYSPRYHKADLRAAAQVVRSHPAAGQAVFVPAVDDAFGYYYRGSGPLIPMYAASRVHDFAAARDTVATKLAGVDSCWVVLARSWHVDPDDQLPAALASLGSLTGEATEAGVRIFRWHRRAEGDARREP